MDMRISSPDAKFYAPKFYTIIYWIGNVAIVIVGIMYAKSILDIGCGYGRGVGKEFALMEFGVIAGTLLALIVWRVTVELVTVFFEQVRVMRQIREELQKSLEINVKIGSALANVLKLMPDIVSGISSLQKQVASLESKVCTANSSSSNMTTNGFKCPVCGRSLGILKGIEPGQRLQCPYCNGKFVFESLPSND